MDEQELFRVLAAVAVFLSLCLGALLSLILSDPFLVWFGVLLGSSAISGLIWTVVRAHRK